MIVEILPKVDELRQDEWAAQRNLLHMLRRAGWLPFLDSGQASLAAERGSLLDVFAWLFANGLLAEWKRGPDRAYVRREENLTCLRGKLLIPQNVRRNAVNRERLFVAHDVLEEDTPVNRLLKAAVRKLLSVVVDRETKHLLGVLHEEMSFVSDVSVREAAKIRAPLGRTNERYRRLRDFAQMVLGTSSPSPRAGDDGSFSLLFPMERVFESYVARTLRAWAPRLGFARARVRMQAVGDRRSLLRSIPGGTFRAQLKPDVWIEPRQGERGIVIDTKWKLPSDRGESFGVAPSDVYQMLAYGQAYDASKLLLVYPRYRGYERDWEFRFAQHRLQVVEWPVGGNLISTEEAMFVQAGSWFSEAT